MKKLVIWGFAALFVASVTACSDSEYVEPDPIEEIEMEGAPPLPGESSGEGNGEESKKDSGGSSDSNSSDQ